MAALTALGTSLNGPIARSWMSRPAIGAVLVLMTAWSIAGIVDFATSSSPKFIDWLHLALGANRAGTPELYTELAVGPFRWSPFAAWMLMPVVWLGPGGWFAAHLAAALSFGRRDIVALVLISYPFWHDALSGNLLIFVALAAWWAVHGSKLGILAFFALAILIPRPMMLPVSAWLLWKYPAWRAIFAVMVVAHVTAVAATGLADDWMWALRVSALELEHDWNWAPSRWIGIAWVPIGAGLAIWLVTKGRLGLAAAAVSPYLFPYYLVMLVLEFRRDRT